MRFFSLCLAFSLSVFIRVNRSANTESPEEVSIATIEEDNTPFNPTPVPNVDPKPALQLSGDTDPACVQDKNQPNTNRRVRRGKVCPARKPLVPTVPDKPPSRGPTAVDEPLGTDINELSKYDLGRNKHVCPGDEHMRWEAGFLTCDSGDPQDRYHYASIDEFTYTLFNCDLRTQASSS